MSSLDRVAVAIREAAALADRQPHDTPVTEVLADIADRLDANPAPIVMGMVLKPGDRVLLTIREDVADPQRVQALTNAMQARFPSVEFTLAGGVTITKIEDS